MIELWQDRDIKEVSQNDRNLLFQMALNYEKTGDIENAQRCYLESIEGLEKGSSFTLLPHSLRNLADIYYKKGDYDKAVNFVKVEKFFYESMLIETSPQDYIPRNYTGVGDMSADGDNGMTEHREQQQTSFVHAEQYEHLSRLCLDNSQFDLALEYAGKAARLKHSLLGESHPSTQECLNFFTKVYAEVGKRQYSNSFDELSPAGIPNAPAMSADSSLPITDAAQSPTSILRQRHAPQVTDGDKSHQTHQVRFTEPPRTLKTRDERLSRITLWIILLVASLLLVITILLLFCHSSSCPAVRTHLISLHARLRYYYHHYTRRATHLSVEL